MQNIERTRRRFLAGTSVAVALGLAGCTGSTSQGDGTPTRSEDGSTAAQRGNESTGDGHEDTHESSLDGPSGSATVTMATTDDGSHFEPHVVWVEAGGTVTWELESGTHTTTAYAEKNDRPQRIPAEATGWDSGTLSKAGATFEHTFETPGVYDYLCVPHETMGMLGTVIVGDPDSGDQPGLQPPQDDLPDEAATKAESLNERVTEALGGSGDGHDDSTSHNESEGGN
jgi:plastocyanin